MSWKITIEPKLQHSMESPIPMCRAPRSQSQEAVVQPCKASAKLKVLSSIRWLFGLFGCTNNINQSHPLKMSTKKIYLPKWTGPVLRGEGINCDVLSPNEICQVLWAWRSRSRWVCFTFCWQAQVWQYDMWIFVPNSEKSSSTAQMYFPRSGFVWK